MEAFWTTEYGQNLLSVEQTEIDRLLSSPNTTTLEDLFDEDELLQQCSNKNTQLINFLSKQENITKLVSYITRPWQQHMTQILNHLKEKEKENEQNNNNNNNNVPSSPLSKNGVTRVSSIQEEPNIIQLSDPINDSNDTKDNDIISLAQEIANNDNQNEESNMDSKDKNDILTQIINDNIPNENNDNNEDNTNDDNKDNNIEIKQQNDNDDDDDNDDEFNDTNYDNLQLSDDANNDDNDDENDNNIKTDIISPSNESNDESNDESKPPTLKKKGSIVDMLMDGPQFVDDTELNATNDNDNDNDNDKEEGKIDENMDNDEHNDADPELPDLDVKKETDTDVVVDDNRDILDNNNKDSESKPLIYDSNKDDIPPPPPAPHKPSKLEEFESEIGIEKVKLKYPYLASEIINCQIPQILDTILNENNPFLDMLFDFIVQQPPLNAVLTNYWRSCIVGLVRRNSIVILKYIKARKNLLSSLVQHIRDQSIMELVIALGWDPAIEELKELDEVADWMYNESLVPKLIETLSPLHTPDEHSAASYTLVDIVAKTSRSTNLVLFYNLASEQQIDALMNHMFGGNRSSLLESLSVLLALLHHYPNVSAEKQQFGDGDDHNNQIPPPPPTNTTTTQTIKIIGATTTNINPLAPKQSDIDPLTQNINPLAQIQNDTDIIPLHDDDNKNENENETETTNQKDDSECNKNENENENENEPEIVAEVLDDGNQEEDIKFDDTVPAVVKAVCVRLNEFKILLEDDNLPDLRLPFVHLSPPLGPVRHKVVDMIVALMRTPSTVVSSKLRSLGLICKCIDLFFLYPWNNLLHGSVEHIIQMVVSGDCSILKAALFEDCDFLNRILKARELSAKHQEKSGFRLGYMGHITRVSNTIVEFAKRNKQLLEYMQLNEDWMKFIADDLKLENEQLNTQLGGHRPSALNGDDDVDDFTLFTLNDITNHNDDINDNEQILADINDINDINRDNDNDDDDDDDDDDSDSDSDEDENRNKYEMPQDAFTKLTQKIDKENQNDDDKPQEQQEQQKQQEQQQQQQQQNDNNETNQNQENNKENNKETNKDNNKKKNNNNEDFDSWLNDDENWNDFDADNNNNENNENKSSEKPVLNKEINGDIDTNNTTKIQDENKENKENTNVENTTAQNNSNSNKANNNGDDFDNWDTDPFADDIFADNNNKNNKETIDNNNDNNNNNNASESNDTDIDKEKEKEKDKQDNDKLNNGHINKIEQQTVVAVND